MRFDKMTLDPAHNPAVLDTATWDSEAAWRLVAAAEASFWLAVRRAAEAGQQLPSTPACQAHEPSLAQGDDGVFFLASLSDGQQVLLEVSGDSTAAPLGAPAAQRALTSDARLRMYPTDAPTLDCYCRLLRPDKGPRALGAVPRLGISSRMTTALWPAAYAAMAQVGFAANPIQNSVREAHLLDTILQARPSQSIYYPGFGNVESGHTGSTFQGLWTYGVLEALKSPTLPRYGADADHLKVQRGPAGATPALAVIAAAPYYTFYTIDVSDRLDYAALGASPADAVTLLERAIPAAGERRALLAYHRHPRRIAGRAYAPGDATIARLVGKYWSALAAMGEIADYLRRQKGGQPFDLEFAIDEHPPAISPFECITTDEEMMFVALEIDRRRLPITHIAPNCGIEKGVDYRAPGGLPALESRLRAQCQIAAEFGLLIDLHSADDLGAATRRVIGRAANGRLHYKLAPTPQLLFAEAVQALEPGLFRAWYADALDYAQGESAAGSTFAARCLREVAGDATPSVSDSVFHNYGFAYVGRRDASGAYVNRARLYTLPAYVYQDYGRRLIAYLTALANDLFAPAGT